MYNIELPPFINVSASKRKSKEYIDSVLTAFESIGYQQFQENIVKFQDYYDMIDGNLTHTEIKSMLPNHEDLIEAMEEAELDTFVRHYDFIGSLINALVGRFIDMKEKFHVIESGEVAKNEFLDFKNEKMAEIANEVISQAIKLQAAKRGVDLENPDKEFSSEEEQQAYIQQLEQFKKQYTPKVVEIISKFPNFKTSGISWAEHTLDRDNEVLKMDSTYAELFKHWLLTGVCAKITKVYYDTYKTYAWDSREVFHSKDVSEKYLNKFEYAGRFHYKTPAQAVEEYGHKMTEKQKRELLSSNGKWGDLFSEATNLRYSPKETMKRNFNERHWAPTFDFHNRKFYERLEAYTGVPMGNRYVPNYEDGKWDIEHIFMPRKGGINNHYVGNAGYVDSRYNLRTDLCQITEVYTRVYEKLGWLTYEDEFGMIVQEVVTEDILPEFLKEKGIKTVITETFDEILHGEPKVNTLSWHSLPVYYEGIRINGGGLEEPMNVCFERMELRITDLSTYECKNPVSGIITTSIASKLRPYQEMHNVMWNQIRNISENELGSFFLTALESAPSEYGGESAEDTMIQMRNTAKKTRMLPIRTNPDTPNGSQSIFNQFQAYNLSAVNEIQWRMQVAEKVMMMGYAQIGLNPQQAMSPVKYTNEEGIKLSNESMNDQLATIYETFNDFIKEDKIQHLSIVHFLQSVGRDKTMYYTNSYNHNIYLDMTKDEKFAMRRFGMILSDDSRKRKEFETYKQYILQQNTMAGDMLSFGKVMFSDTASELLQIAEEERQLAIERQQLESQSRINEIEAQNKAQMERDEANWMRNEESKQRDRVNRIHVADVKAIGDASDNNASLDQLKFIQTVADINIKQSETEVKNQQRLAEIDNRREELANKKAEAQNKIASDYEKMQHQREMKEKDVQIALANKN